MYKQAKTQVASKREWSKRRTELYLLEVAQNLLEYLWQNDVKNPTASSIFVYYNELGLCYWLIVDSGV